MSTRPDSGMLAGRTCPRTLAGLTALLGETAGASFERLARAIEESPGFFQDTLPFLWKEALAAHDRLPEHPLLDGPGSLELTQREALAILVSAFFGTFTRRPSFSGSRRWDLPSIHFDALYGGSGHGDPEVAKLRMILHYFEEMRRRAVREDPLSRPLRLVRTRAAGAAREVWQRCEETLVPPVIHDLGESLDDAKDMLRVDFANRVPGGGVLSHGCVQEEIMFCICPELIVTRLYCPAMEDDEAILVIGSEQFSLPVGYARSLEFGGPYVDRSARLPDGALHSYIVALDAIDYRGTSTAGQYQAPTILRELIKCWAGFSIDGTPSDVATGNWGCGAFRGDPELKSLIQWLAISRARRTMHYFPWDQARLRDELPGIVAMLSGQTVGALASFLLAELAPGNVFAQVRARFGG